MRATSTWFGNSCTGQRYPGSHEATKTQSATKMKWNCAVSYCLRASLIIAVSSPKTDTEGPLYFL